VVHEEDGLVVERGTVDEFLSSIDLILSNQSLAEKLGANALKKAKMYSWKEHAKKLYDIVKKIGT
jgi:glycosyltransferase involved in cell wall biosynthesis